MPLLPTLSLDLLLPADLNKSTIIIPTKVAEFSAAGAPVATDGGAAVGGGTATDASSVPAPGWLRLDHNLQTNQIVYLDLALDIRGLDPSLLPLVPLFSAALTQMGTQRRDFVQLTELIGQKTGGVSVSPFVSEWKGKVGDPQAYLIVRGKAVASKAEDMLAILREVLLEPRLDNYDRFEQMLLQTKAGLETSIQGDGTPFAETRVDAQRNVAGWANELMGGVSYIDYIRGLSDRLQSDWPGVLKQLEAIWAYAVNREGVLINLTGDDALLADVAPGAQRLVEALPTNPRTRAYWGGMLPQQNEAFVVGPTQVSYTCKAANLYYDAGFNLSQAGTLFVVDHYLSTGYLWDLIRVQGGAYGGDASFDLTSGMHFFCAWRDPGLLSSVQAFDGGSDAAKFLADVVPSNDSVTKSIVGAIGGIDAYQLPDAKGLTALQRHILGISDAERQQRRDVILATTSEDFADIAPYLEAAAEAGRVASVTSPEQLAATQKERPGFFGHVQQVI